MIFFIFYFGFFHIGQPVVNFIETEGTPMQTRPTQNLSDRLVDIKTVCFTLSRSRASIYRDINRGDFPKPIKLGGSSRWRVSDLNKAIGSDTRIAA
jgi:predicted DNA-binding transcriptional regulator AlpA